MSKFLEIRKYEHLLQDLKTEIELNFQKDNERNTLKRIELPEILKTNIINKDIVCYLGNDFFYFLNNDDVIFISDIEVINISLLLFESNNSELIHHITNLINAFIYLFSYEYFMYDEQVSDVTHNEVLNLLKSIER